MRHIAKKLNLLEYRPYQDPKWKLPATKEQKEKLDSLGFVFDETITRKQAFKIIKDIKLRKDLIEKRRSFKFLYVKNYIRNGGQR